MSLRQDLPFLNTLAVFEVAARTRCDHATVAA